MKLMGFSAVKFVGPDNFPVWLKVTTKSLEALLEKMENGEYTQDKYFADLLDTDTFEKRYAVLDKPEYLRRALLDTIDGDTLLEGLPILLLDYNAVQAMMTAPPVVAPESEADEEEIEEEIEEEEEAEEEVEEEADEEDSDDEKLCCAHCGKAIQGEGFEWFGLNYCSPECLTAHEVGAA